MAELHEYLNSPSPPPSPPIDRRMSVTSSKSERRRSLPTRTSVVSLAADYNSPEVSDFQLRRRRAAKLTQFFGVDYRDLVRDVLDSIESGLEHEHRRGAINTEEAEVSILVLPPVRRLHPVRTCYANCAESRPSGTDYLNCIYLFSSHVTSWTSIFCIHLVYLSQNYEIATT